jgi:Protein of unknown function (DUF2523)
VPIFIASIIGGLVQAAGSLVGRVLIALGIGYITYTGVDASITWARDFLLAKMAAGLPPLAAQLAGTLKIGVCISILSSALVARMTLQGLTNGTLTRMVQR